MNRTFPLNIQYEDASVLVCVKPAGLPVQTARAGQKDLVSELKNYRVLNGEEPYIGLALHQVFCLDKISRRPSVPAGQFPADREGIYGGFLRTGGHSR